MEKLYNLPDHQLHAFAHALGEDCQNYTQPALEKLLSPQAYAALARVDRLPALRECRTNPTSLATLLRFLLLGDSITDTEFRLAFPKISENDAFIRLLACEKTAENRLSARFSLEAITLDETWPTHPNTDVQENPRTIHIASDFGELAGHTPHENHVMPVGGATRTLASIITYAPGSVLDIGTGCGIHAICAALAGKTVVATDISYRALAYARLNAALAGVTIDFRHGSLFQPVSGLFGTIISNPPFVITPSTVRQSLNFEYRDGGMDGDTLTQQLVAGIPEFLAEKGRAYILFNAEIPYGHQWSSGPSRWAENAGLDAWILGRDELDPAMYAHMWLRDGGLRPRDPGYEENYAAWLDDFEARDVQGISMGYAIFGHPAPTTPARAIAHMLPGPIPGGLREFLGRCWENRNLAALSDAEFVAKKLVKVGVVEHRYYEPGNEAPLQIVFTQTQGVEHNIPVGAATAGVVGACDGELDVDTLCTAVAHILEEPVDDVYAQVVPALRELCELGMLVESAQSCG